MVDSRSLNAVTPTSSFNFKSGDISGTAAKMSDEKMGQGSEYFQTNPQQPMMMPDQMYVDRSAQLRATLNSLAMMNVANLLANKKKKQLLNATLEDDEIDEAFENIEANEQELIDEILNKHGTLNMIINTNKELNYMQCEADLSEINNLMEMLRNSIRVRKARDKEYEYKSEESRRRKRT